MGGRSSDREPVAPAEMRLANGTLRAATLALTAGVPLHVVAARLGDHPQTLLATYAYLLPHSDVMAAEAVAAAIVDKPLTDPVVVTPKAP